MQKKEKNDAGDDAENTCQKSIDAYEPGPTWNEQFRVVDKEASQEEQERRRRQEAEPEAECCYTG